MSKAYFIPDEKGDNLIWKLSLCYYFTIQFWIFAGFVLAHSFSWHHLLSLYNQYHWISTSFLSGPVLSSQKKMKNIRTCLWRAYNLVCNQKHNVASLAFLICQKIDSSITQSAVCRTVPVHKLHYMSTLRWL